jgi:hypothetical protein
MLEKPHERLDLAQKQLQEKSIKLYKKSMELGDRARGLSGNAQKERDMMLDLANKLHDKAKEYKDKHQEFESKKEILLARKILAEETLSLQKSGTLLAGDDLNLCDDLEREIQAIEVEVNAFSEFLKG